MCRINTDPKFDLIKLEKSKVSPDSVITVIIEDQIEGNMTFNIKVVEEECAKSITRLEFADEHTGNVIIVNPNPASNIQPSEPMEVGTYKGCKKLFMDFKLYKQYTGEDYRQINIEFGTIKSENNG